MSGEARTRSGNVARISARRPRPLAQGDAGVAAAADSFALFPRPHHTPGRKGFSPREVELIENFIERMAPDRHAGPDVAAERVLPKPPREQGLEILIAADFPVELRDQVIAPAFGEPQARIGVEIGI